MARTKTPSTEISLVSTEEQQEFELAVTAATDEARLHQSLIMNRYGNDLAYDRKHFMTKAANHFSRSSDELLEGGLCLIVLKSNEPHGEWLNVLTQMKLEHSMACRLMQAALKYSDNQTTGNVLNAAKSKTKLFELMVLDDEQLEELNDGGTVANLTLDDVSRMSCSELRKALREARKEADAKDDVITNKQNHITKIEKQAALIQRQTPDEKTKKLCAEIAAQQTGIDQELRINFYNALETLRTHSSDHQTFIDAQLQMLTDVVDFLRSAFTATGVEWESAE